MTDSWRIKTYYDKRVLIETERVLASSFEDTIICLTGAELEMLRNLTQYLHRRSTFAQDYTKTRYLAPTSEDWDTISSLVANLEDKLMGCDIDELVTAINNLTTVQSAMMTCICAMEDWQQVIAGRLPDLAGYVTNEDVSYLSPTETDTAPVTPGSDTEKCEFAQAVFYWVYQFYTETLLPFASATSDSLVAAIVAATAFGALAGFIGIPVAILATLVSAAFAWAMAGSIANFTNWLWDNKDEIVCTLYNYLPDYDAAASAMRVLIDDAVTLSYLDRQLLKTVLASTWHYSWIIFDQKTNGTWDDSFIPGQCDLCELVPPECQSFMPCTLGDWQQGTPGDLICNGNYPQVRGGYSIFKEPETVIVAYDMWLKVWWIPRGESTHATADFDVRVGENQETQIALYPTSSMPVDVLTSDTYTFQYDGVGTPVSIQVIQNAWYFDVVWMCFYDEDPDA